MLAHPLNISLAPTAVGFSLSFKIGLLPSLVAQALFFCNSCYQIFSDQTIGPPQRPPNLPVAHPARRRHFRDDLILRCPRPTRTAAVLQYWFHRPVSSG
jgi:hypothetical protein